jgi:hypothetical protein
VFDRNIRRAIAQRDVPGLRALKLKGTNLTPAHRQLLEDAMDDLDFAIRYTAVCQPSEKYMLSICKRIDRHGAAFTEDPRLEPMWRRLRTAMIAGNADALKTLMYANPLPCERTLNPAQALIKDMRPTGTWPLETYRTPGPAIDMEMTNGQWQQIYESVIGADTQLLKHKLFLLFCSSTWSSSVHIKLAGKAHPRALIGLILNLVKENVVGWAPDVLQHSDKFERICKKTHNVRWISILQEAKHVTKRVDGSAT